MEEYDIAMYTIKSIDDPRTLNKTVYIRPPENILSQREVVQIWEKLIGKELHKSSISAEQFLSSMEGEINIIHHQYYLKNAKSYIIYIQHFLVMHATFFY